MAVSGFYNLALVLQLILFVGVAEPDPNTTQVESTTSTVTTTYGGQTESLTEVTATVAIGEVESTTVEAVSTIVTTTSDRATESTTVESVTQATINSTTPTGQDESATEEDAVTIVTNTSKSPVEPTTEEVATDDPIDCLSDSQCENNGVCNEGQCTCPCQYTGWRCEIAAQCFECSMTLLEINGNPATFTKDLRDPESEEFANEVRTILPLIDKLMHSTENVSKDYISSNISGFENGSLIVQFTITLSEHSALSADELQRDMENALSNNSQLLAEDGSLSVEAASVEQFDGLKTLVYVGSGISLFVIILLVVLFICKSAIGELDSENIVMMNLCLALAGLFVLFITLNATGSIEGEAKMSTRHCFVLAGFTHYFILMTIALTVMQSLVIYRFIKESDFKRTTFFSYFVWGLVAIVLVITGLASKDTYAQRHFCFPSKIPLIVTIIVPAAIALFIDMVMYIAAILKTDGRHKMVLMYTLFVVLIYLTWIPAFLSYLPGFAPATRPIFFVFSLLMCLWFMLYICNGDTDNDNKQGRGILKNDKKEKNKGVAVNAGNEYVAMKEIPQNDRKI